MSDSWATANGPAQSGHNRERHPATGKFAITCSSRKSGSVKILGRIHDDARSRIRSRGSIECVGQAERETVFALGRQFKYRSTTIAIVAG